MALNKNRSCGQPQQGRWVSPFLVLFAIVFVTSALAVPVGYGLDTRGYFDLFRRRLGDGVILAAYLWTLYALGSMLLLYYLLGTHRNISAYQRLPFREFSQGTYRRLWGGSLALGLLLTAVMLIQAGFRIPIVEGIGTEYLAYTRMRLDFAKAISQTLFNLALYLVATPNLILGWVCIQSNKGFFRVLSLVLFALVGSFTLHRSPVGFALFMVLNFYILSKPVTLKPIAYALAGSTLIMAGLHFLADEPIGYGSRFEYMVVRVAFGQWMGVPYYFEVFADKTEPVSVLLPGYLHEFMGNAGVSPARTVMDEIAPGAAAEGEGDVASAFFVGEAYAVAGVTGVIVSPLMVSVQIWLMTVCFKMLRVNVITRCLYAWFLLKVMLGLFSGVSAFAASGLLMTVCAVGYWTFARQVALAARRQGALQA